MHAAGDVLQVEDDFGHVLGNAGNRGELVSHPLDPRAGDGGAGQRREQHSAQGGAERVAEAAIERLDRERTAVVLDLFGGDLGCLELEHQCPWVGAPRAPGNGVARTTWGYFE